MVVIDTTNSWAGDRRFHFLPRRAVMLTVPIGRTWGGRTIFVHSLF